MSDPEMKFVPVGKTGIALRYRDCWEIDGRLVHGYDCKCTPRDRFFRALNLEQRTGEETV